MVTATADTIFLTVTDLKQWSYCPRIPFYRYVMPVDHVRTYKMQRGKAVQAVTEALERRRRLREYGLAVGERHFDVWLRSQELGLTGRLDLLIVTPEACLPVDFKDTEGGVRRNHRTQLAAYTLLVEEAFGKPVPAAFVYLVPKDQVVEVEVSQADRDEVVGTLARLRQMILEERMPDPTPLRARCGPCEYQNYCADIW
jgi:CRISPR-associated exonuclease Cas4